MDFDRPRKATPEKIDVEIIIIDISVDELLLKTDEDGQAIWLPRYGTKLFITKEPYAVLTLTESRAIAYGLI